MSHEYDSANSAEQSQGRFARRVAAGAATASRGRKKAHPPARCAGPAAARPALGTSREGLWLRFAAGQSEADQPLRWMQPAHHLPFHVRPGVEGGLPELLV